MFTCWFGCWISQVLFCQQRILFTVTELLDEELIRICIQRIKPSVGMLRHLHHLSHLLVGFMLYEISLFILWGTSDVWLDLLMPLRAPSRNMKLPCDENAMFCNISLLAQWDSPHRYHLVKLIWFMIMAHSQADRLSRSLESPKWNWSSHAQAKLEIQSSLRNSLSHPILHTSTLLLVSNTPTYTLTLTQMHTNQTQPHNFHLLNF